MDVGTNVLGPSRKKDIVGDRVQKLFQDFLSEYVNFYIIKSDVFFYVLKAYLYLYLCF